MLDMYTNTPITKTCYISYLIFIIMFPFRIIGTLHIAANVSMLVWILLI